METLHAVLLDIASRIALAAVSFGLYNNKTYRARPIATYQLLFCWIFHLYAAHLKQMIQLI